MKIIKKIQSFIESHSDHIQNFFFVLVLLSLFVQSVDLGATMWNRAQPLRILRALDDDEANGVSVALRTRIYNDSDFHTYGVLYYRVVHLTQHLVTPLLQKGVGETTQLRTEMAHDFVLDLVSLLALYLIAFQLATLLTPNPFFKGLGILTLVAAFTNSNLWPEMLFAAKPDIFLCAVLLCALIQSWKTVLDPENKKKLFGSAICWGMVFSTKLIAIYFTPVLLILMYGPRPWRLTRPPWDRVKYFLKIMLITYFAIGFPNNFTLIPPIKNLLEQSSYLRPIDWDFFLHWCQLWWGQIRWPLVTLLILFWIVPTDPSTKTGRLGQHELKRLSHLTWVLLLITVLAPTLWLFSKKTITFHEWYPLPFVTGALGLLSFATPWAHRIKELLFGAKMISFQNSVYWTIAVFILFPYAPLSPNENLQKVFNAKMQCTTEARQVASQIDLFLNQGKKLLMDPLVPYVASRPPHPNAEVSWEMSRTLLEQRNPDLLVLKRNYYETFFPVSEGGSQGMTAHIKNLPEVQEFYRPLRSGTEFKDPMGHLWKKIYQDPCTFEIWQKI